MEIVIGKIEDDRHVTIERDPDHEDRIFMSTGKTGRSLNNDNHSCR